MLAAAAARSTTAGVSSTAQRRIGGSPKRKRAKPDCFDRLLAGGRLGAELKVGLRTTGVVEKSRVVASARSGPPPRRSPRSAAIPASRGCPREHRLGLATLVTGHRALGQGAGLRIDDDERARGAHV